MAKHILIVGGGVIGLCSAYYAMREGHQVTIVERGAANHDSCSLGNAGMIVPSHFVPMAAPGMVAYGLRAMRNPESPFYVKPRLDLDLARWGLLFMQAANAGHVDRSAPLLRDMNMASRKAYEDLAERFGDIFGLTKRGLLMLCKTEHTLQEESEVARKASALGIPAQVISPEEAAKVDPGVRMDIAGAVYFPQDCHLSPRAFVAGLTAALVAGGVKLRWETEAIGWLKSSRRIVAVETEDGALTADEFVLAGGSWSPVTLRSLGLRLPMQAGKGYSVTLPKPRQLPDLCSIFTEARVAVTPMGSTLRIGGTMEIAGLDTSITERRVKGILRSIPEYFPDFAPEDFADLPVWSGLRPCSPDGLPYIGRFQKYSNLSAATGHSMMGLSLAPVTGKLMADVLAGRKTPIDIEALRPDRYA